MREKLTSYFDTLFKLTNEAECTEMGGARITIDAACEIVSGFCHSARRPGVPRRWRTGA